MILFACIFLNLFVIDAAANECANVALVSSAPKQIPLSVQINRTENGEIFGYFENYRKSGECLKLMLDDRYESHDERIFAGGLIIEFFVNGIAETDMNIIYYQTAMGFLTDKIFLQTEFAKDWMVHSLNISFDWAYGVRQYASNGNQFVCGI